MVTIVATLTEENRVHELLADRRRWAVLYSIQTSIGGKLVAVRTLTTEQAGEWVELARRDGVVHEGVRV